MRWNKMKACRPGNASVTCASFVSAPQRTARGWPSSPGYPSSRRSRSIRTAIMPCSAMLATSILARRRNCSWVASPSTSRSTSRCAIRPTLSRPCTTLGRTSVARQPSCPHCHSSAALGLGAPWAARGPSSGSQHHRGWGRSPRPASVYTSSGRTAAIPPFVTGGTAGTPPPRTVFQL